MTMNSSNQRRNFGKYRFNKWEPNQKKSLSSDFFSMEIFFFVKKKSVIYPFDVIRKHMQLNKELRYSKDAIAFIYKQRGFRGFYRGLWPHFLTVTHFFFLINFKNQKKKILQKVIPGAAIGLVVYDLLKYALCV